MHLLGLANVAFELLASVIYYTCSLYVFSVALDLFDWNIYCPVEDKNFTGKGHILFKRRGVKKGLYYLKYNPYFFSL